MKCAHRRQSEYWFPNWNVLFFFFVHMFLQSVTGWLGETKASCILRHRGVQLMLAYSWARPTVLAARKSRGGGMFLFFLFLHCHSFSFLPCPIFFISSTLSSIPLPPFSGRRHKMTHKVWRVVKPQHNQLQSIQYHLPWSRLFFFFFFFFFFVGWVGGGGAEGEQEVQNRVLDIFFFFSK